MRIKISMDESGFDFRVEGLHGELPLVIQALSCGVSIGHIVAESSPPPSADVVPIVDDDDDDPEEGEGEPH